MLEALSENYKPGDWIATLPTYQQTRIREQTGAGLTEDDIAEYWGSGASNSNIAPFGGNGSNNYYKALLREFRSLICGDARYKDTREKITNTFDQGRLVIISIIAGAIATALNVAVIYVMPVVALLLEVVCKTGINAWCQVTSGEKI
nr:hypothetical protein [Brucella anthropi]